ncbi:MAG: ABC transporter permease, partial [Chloroflexota bacterium]|nr:ABC transporter permease [Chloroflexota bacterium]
MDMKDKNAQPEFATASANYMMPDTSGMMPPDITEPDMRTTLPAPPPGTQEDIIPGKVTKSPTPLQDSLRRLRRDKRAMASLGVILFFVLLALVGPFIYQHIGGPYQSTTTGTAVGPDQYHNYSHQGLDRQDEL